MSKNLISSLSWVRRGVAVQHPSKYVLDDKEIERVSTLARVELGDARVELERAAKSTDRRTKGHETDDADSWMDEDEDQKPAEADDLSQYNLDNYDDDDPEPATVGLFSNIKGLTYYRNNEKDPYITLKDDDDDERAELEILPTDNLLVVAKTEDEISQLEIYVYDDSQESLYVHHDLMLPNFPLCLEWLDFPPAPSTEMANTPEPTQSFGNYIAVGTLDPEIEIWSLDVVEAMYPDMVLGRPDKTAMHVPTPLGTGKKKRKKDKHRSISSAYHVDAVLALSWNRIHRNLLASASADRTVKLWDLSRNPNLGQDRGGVIRSFDKMHKDKVQAVRWNTNEPTVLLTGSYDHTVRTFDTRTPDVGVGSVVGADVESLQWDPWDHRSFYVSLENGLVLNFDVRTLPNDLNSSSPARFTLQAHDGAVSALDINPHIPGCIATGGTDKMVKVWNVAESEDGKQNVTLATSRDLGVGKVFSAVFSPDDPLILAAAGSKAKLQIWNVGANFSARKVFASKLAMTGKTLTERESGIGVIGVQSDEEDDEGNDQDLED